MKRLIKLSMACLIPMSHCTSPEVADQTPIMGSLNLGKYQTGFKTLFVYDESRSAVPYADWDGNLYQNQDPNHGRQYQINLWYPSQVGSGTPLKYEHYIHLMGRQTNFSNTPEQRTFARKIFINQTNDLGGDGNFTAKELDLLLELNVTARSEAKPLDEQFPIVLFPNGGSPAYQSITAEYLTSHGYVVVAFAPKGRFSSLKEVSGIGLEVAIDDLEYVVGQVAQLPFVDINNIGLMANAIGSSVCAAAIARNDKYKGLVSLEGGLPSAFEQRLLRESVYYQPENITAPMLFLYAPHPSIDPQHTYHLQHSERYYAHFPTMSEFVMLNYGMLDTFIPDIVGKQKAPPKEGFETANKLMLRFLDIQLKGRQAELFSQDFTSLSEKVIDSTFVLPAIPAAPNIALMKNLFLKRGFDGIDSTYYALKAEGAEKPLSMNFFSAYRSWLAWQKDPEYQHRARLYILAYDSYPKSAEANYYLGYYLQKTGSLDSARAAYERTIQYLPESDLSKDRRETLMRYSQEGLEEIDQSK